MGLSPSFSETDNEPKETTRSSGTSNLTHAWKWKESVLICESEGVKNSNKIASFDFDGTLAKTSLFKHGPDAWSILYPSCVPTLTRFHEDGYKLVIFTNQASIGKAKATKEKVIAEKKGRLMGFVTEVRSSEFQLVNSFTIMLFAHTKLLYSNVCSLFTALIH